MQENPFIIKGYAGARYFCGREKETSALMGHILGNSDTVLISPRRYGKSGLLLHVLDQLKREHPEYDSLYTDISITSSLGGLIDHLSNAILSAFPEKSSLGKKFLAFLKALRPYFTFNENTGKAEVHLEMASPLQKEHTLQQIFDILEQHSSPVLLVIDEFQQITEYPETNVEALLRSHIQHMHNVRFIFSGSKRRMMASIFNDAARPFYASCVTMHLNKLDNDVYAGFIRHQFNDYGRSIEEDALNLILEWTRKHTYYTQRVCHNLFDRGNRVIDFQAVRNVFQDILEGESYNFLLLRDILPVQQWRFLVGVAKEGSVSQITSNSFVSRHKIGSTATALRCAQSLEEKELILKTLDTKGSTYEVYNVFFSRWLEQEY